jgi:uncharacterized RDD family membrane protein YckC
MTTAEPPGEPTPPSFEKPAAGGSPYDTPPPTGGGSPYGDGPTYQATPTYQTPRHAPPPPGQQSVSEMPPLGGLGTRLMAQIIDWVLLLVAVVPLSVLAYVSFNSNHNLAGVIIEVIAALLGFLYEGLMLTLAGGQTVGMKVMGVRVAMLANGDVPVGSAGWIRSAVFWLPGLLNAFCLPALFQLLNILWCTWDRPYQQCLHDKAAKTVVVKAT